MKIVIEKTLLDDDSGIAPDSYCEGYWPSRDESSPGYVPPDRFEEEEKYASKRYEAWLAGEWRYVTMIVTATVTEEGAEKKEYRSIAFGGLESDSEESLREAYEEGRYEVMKEMFSNL